MAGNVNNVSRFPRMYECQDSVGRPANTTAYVAGDTVSDHTTATTTAGYFTFDFKTTAQGYGSITLTDFTFHKSDEDTANASFSLLLFTTAPALANIDDGSPCAITDAEMKECKGVVKFSATDWTNVILGDIQTVSKSIGIVMASASSIVYGILIADAAYTPGSGEILTITAHAIQD